eukprot:7789297-Pyramimonas_sp.AAC.1
MGRLEVRAEGGLFLQQVSRPPPLGCSASPRCPWGPGTQGGGGRWLSISPQAAVRVDSRKGAGLS